MKTLTHSDVLKMLPDRLTDTHKGDYGRILLLCGSQGYTGAAALAAMGALRSGVGLVYLGVPESIYQIEAVKLTEPIVFPLPDEGGKFSANATEVLKTMLYQMDAVLIGPGIGQSDGTQFLTGWVLKNYDGPIVLDADGINVLVSHKDILRDRTAPTILTPHPGEFCRIAGEAIVDRMIAAKDLADDLGVIMVLKGHRTVITDGKNCYLNETGNPGMAVGGSGDVLAGIITAFIGLGLQPFEAAACGVWVHGAAGDLCADQLGQHGMLPSDIINVLPRLLK